MAEPIIEIVSAVVGTFTVDTALNEVPVVNTSNPFVSGRVLVPPYIFDQNDNFNLLSFQVTLPYCFCFSNDSGWPRLSLFGIDTAVAAFPIQALPADGQLWVPLENVEHEARTFLPFSVNPYGNTWYLNGELIEAHVSCINAPASLDEEELEIRAYIKIAHNLPLLT